MKTNNFNYLLSYISSSAQEIYPTNSFYSVSEKEVQEAERRLGYQFPSQLRNFYQEVGYGFLQAPHEPPSNYKFFNINRINSPRTIADIIQLGHESGYISEEALECMEPGDLPFFEISDSSSFLVMRPKSDNPNAIYSDTGVLIEHEFNRFIWRLYYESPCYFERIIEAHYAALDQE